MTSSLGSDDARWWALPVGATLAVVAVVANGIEPRLLPALYLAVVTPTLAASDIRHRRLPNRVVLPGYVAGAVGIAGQWTWTGVVPVPALVGGAAFGLGMLVLALVGGVGMGDVKLAGLIGITAGLGGPAVAIAPPVAAFLLGGLAAITALRSGDRSIPFGLHLLAGLWIALLLAPDPL